MSENTNENLQVKEAQVASTEKKPIRVGFIFLSIVPVAALVVIQSLAQMPFLVLAFVDLMKQSDITDPLELFTSSPEALAIFNEKYSLWAFLLYSVIGLIVFGLWYFKGFVKNKQKVKNSETFSVTGIIASVLVVVALQFAITAGFILAYKIFPNVMENYSQLMESAGIVNNVFLTVVYAIILGPIIEELCLRGLSYGYLEKSGIKPIFVILISGILFGVMHLNLVQGIYASVLGFILGYIRYKYRTVRFVALVHILFNIMGTYGNVLVSKLDLSEGVSLILGGVSLFVLVFALVLINRDKKSFKGEA